MISEPISEPILSSLELLPMELLLCIKDVLEDTDAICLSMCSQTLRQVIKPPRGPIHDKSLSISVLNKVARDLPGQFCCAYCAELHPIPDVGRPSESYSVTYQGIIYVDENQNTLVLAESASASFGFGE